MSSNRLPLAGGGGRLPPASGVSRLFNFVSPQIGRRGRPAPDPDAREDIHNNVDPLRNNSPNGAPNDGGVAYNIEANAPDQS